MSDKLNTKPFQNLLCEVCGQKVNVSTGDGYWRVDPSEAPWKILGWHFDHYLAGRANGTAGTEGRKAGSQS